MIWYFINVRMIVEIFSIINRGFFYFIDSRINHCDCGNFIIRPLPVAGTVFNHPAGRPQIGQGMQIIRMIRRTRTALHDQ